ALPRRVADSLGPPRPPGRAHRAPVRVLLPQVVLLGVRSDLAPLDPAAYPRRPDDDHVLEVSRADRVRESARHGGLDGGVPGRPARGADGPLPPRRGAAGRLCLAGDVSPPARGTHAGGAELQSALDGADSVVRSMGFGTYLRNIKDAALTIADGMAVTFSHLVRRPYTVQYPDRLPDGVRVQDTLPFRYRGILEVDLEICTACLACERACPIDYIVVDAEKDKAAGGLVMTRFDIDLAKCMYCGLCSEPCPTGAIHHTPEFEGADYSLESLVRKFVKTPVLAYKPKKGGETDPEIAPILERGMRYVNEFASADA